jgi:hypothetical protein
MTDNPIEGIDPGTVQRVNDEQLRQAWAVRDTNRPAALAVFRDAVFSYRRHEMLDVLGVTREELTDFLAPRLPAETAAWITPLIPTGRAGSAEAKSTGDPEELDRAIGELRHAGWYVSEIAAGLGLSRPAVSKFNPSGPVDPVDVGDDTRIPEPHRVRFFSKRMVPQYIFVDAPSAVRTRRDIPAPVVNRLMDLDATLMDKTRSAAFAQAEGDYSGWEKVRRAELSLVTYARKQSAELGVSLVSMSRLLRPNNRHYLARMARRHGIAEHVPDSVAAVSPVRTKWEKSRNAVVDAMEHRDPRAHDA